MTKVPFHIAMQPRPTAPDCLKWSEKYFHYLQDLACWKAMKADCLLEGIEEPNQIKNNKEKS